MNKISLVALVLLSCLSACSYQKNNNIDQDDVRENDAYIYGVHKDSTAKQLKQTYTAKPELEARTAKIKEILYGPAEVSNTAETTAAVADTTKK